MNHDVEHIERLTKHDLIDFFDVHVDPASTQRAKAVVHLMSQTSPEEVAAKADPQEQTAKLAEMLGQILGQMGVSADAPKLHSRLAKVNVAGGDVDGITSAVSEYLIKDAAMPSADAEKLTAQSAPVLSQVLPALGIRTNGAAVQDDNASTTSSEAKLPAIKEAEVIEDVRAFKASMPLSEGTRPVKDLSEFEDLEPKL